MGQKNGRSIEDLRENLPPIFNYFRTAFTNFSTSTNSTPNSKMSLIFYLAREERIYLEAIETPVNGPYTFWKI